MTEDDKNMPVGDGAGKGAAQRLVDVESASKRTRLDLLASLEAGEVSALFRPVAIGRAVVDAVAICVVPDGDEAFEWPVPLAAAFVENKAMLAIPERPGESMVLVETPTSVRLKVGLGKRTVPATFLRARDLAAPATWQDIATRAVTVARWELPLPPGLNWRVPRGEHPVLVGLPMVRVESVAPVPLTWDDLWVSAEDAARLVPVDAEPEKEPSEADATWETLARKGRRLADTDPGLRFVRSNGPNYTEVARRLGYAGEKAKHAAAMLKQHWPRD